MWWCNLVFLLIVSITVSNGFNISNNFEKIAIPDRFMENLQSFLINKGTKISPQCKSDLKTYIRKSLSDIWPWLMFDAGSKISSGILSGNWVDLGQFDQCLNIEAQISKNNTIFGKYCLGSIPLSSEMLKSVNPEGFKIPDTPEARMMNPSGQISAMFATCLPDSCSSTDIQRLYSWIGLNIQFYDSLCQSKSATPTLTGGDIATISFLCVVFGVMLLSTTYDVILSYSNQKPKHSLLIAFSVFSNGKKLLATSKDSNQISCLHGIRVISMMWVMLAHRYALENALPKQNYIDGIKWMFDEVNMFVMGGTVSVDTFFLLSGFLVSYSFLAAMAKGIKFNIIMFYIHRYLRLTPIIAVIILIYVTVLKHLGSGPLWNIFERLLSEGCKEYWWSALLYIQNYVNPEAGCVNQTWYLSVDTQLFLLSPLVLIPLKRRPAVGLIVTIIFLFGSTLSSFLVGWFYELSGFVLANQDTATYMTHYYYQTYTRAGPWLVGILLGYYIYEIKQNHKKVSMNTVITLLLWMLSLTILCACVYTGNNTLKSTYEYDRIANSFYVALLRPGWALGVAWVIFACVTGRGGPINWFLSLSMFQVASKFTYSMYLIHGALQIIISGQIRSSAVFSNLDTLYKFWGDFAFTFATAVLFTLAFESPIIIIEKVIFSTGKAQPKRAIAEHKCDKSAEIP